MTIPDYITGITTNITTKIQKKTIPPVIIGNALTDLATIVSGITYGGSTTLTSGSTTVSNSTIKSTSTITFSYITPNGTLGFLQQGTINPGISFIINSLSSSGSLNTSDGSIVNYLILI